MGRAESKVRCLSREIPGQGSFLVCSGRVGFYTLGSGIGDGGAMPVGVFLALR